MKDNLERLINLGLGKEEAIKILRDSYNEGVRSTVILVKMGATDSQMYKIVDEAFYNCLKL